MAEIALFGAVTRRFSGTIFDVDLMSLEWSIGKNYKRLPTVPHFGKSLFSTACSGSSVGRAGD